MTNQREDHGKLVTRVRSDEIARYAAKNVPLPDDRAAVCAADQLLWYKLRDIYTDYGAGKITADEGAERKGAAVLEHDRYIGDIVMLTEAVDRQARFWKDVEAAANAYRLSPSIEAADRFLEAVYGAGRIG